MGARSGGRAASAWVGLLVALLLVSVGFVPVVALGEGEEEQEALEEVLFFTQRPGRNPEFNVSTYAPGAEDKSSVREGTLGGDFGLETSWGWRLPIAPANWSIGSDDQWKVILYISGWEEYIPIASPLTDLDAIGQHRVDVTLTFEDDQVAFGATHIDPELLNEGVKRISIPIDFAASSEFKNDRDTDTILIDILVTGQRKTTDSTLDLHFGSTKHSSKIEVPGYPVQALRVWEDQFLWEQYCVERQLEQKQCEKNQNGPPPINGSPEENGTPPVNNTDNESETAPAPSILLILSLAIGGLLLFTRARQGSKN